MYSFGKVGKAREGGGNTEDEYISTRVAAQMLGVSMQAVRDLWRAGVLAGVMRETPGGKTRLSVRRADVEARRSAGT